FYLGLAIGYEVRKAPDQRHIARPDLPTPDWKALHERQRALRDRRRGTGPFVEDTARSFIPPPAQPTTPRKKRDPSEPRAAPVYDPPPDQPGKPTELVGGPEGWQFQVFDEQRRPAVGFRYEMGSWAGQPAVREFSPLFNRDAAAGGASLEIA